MGTRGGKWVLGIAGAVLLLLGGYAAADQLRLPADYTFPPLAASPGPVVYSHEFHAAFADKCTVCHVQLFPILHPTPHVSHSEMNAGRSCGACHNGQMAFGTADPASCERCHASKSRRSS